ncbi:MAG: amidohydrolase [Deltaproteobacteria bacterium]|nr:amidohydrolase [Deltaproteobacteria bacterium]
MTSAIDYMLISTDDHIIEPPDVWHGRLEAKYQSRAPQIVELDGEERWVFEDQKLINTGLSVMAGKKYEDYNPKAARFADMRPGCYDPKERLKDMDLDGIEAQVLFPSTPGMAGQTFSEANDKELALRCLQTYNDWLADSWCAPNPRRLIGQTIVPLWDMRLAVAEFQRGLRLGHKALSMPNDPQSMGYPRLSDRYWDPLWDTVEEAGVPVSMHIASGTQKRWFPLTPGEGSPATVFITVGPTANFTVIADMIFSGLLHRHPKLRFVSAEGGIGWIGYLLQRADEVYHKHRHWSKPPITEKPSFYFRRQIFANFLDDAVGITARHHIGVDNLMFEVDYPHSDTTFPNSRRIASERFSEVPAGEARKIFRDNAIRLFKLDLA